MTGSIKVIAAAVSALVLVYHVPGVQAQSAPRPLTRIAGLASGSIGGVVEDERGAPIPGALVSALGAKTATAVTDHNGRFELRRLSPGPYVLRAHVSGFVGARGQVVEVKASARTTFAIALRHASSIAPSPTPVTSPPEASSSPSPPILTAGIGVPGVTEAPEHSAQSDTTLIAPVESSDQSSEQSTFEDDHGETAWRLRHLRRSILKDVTVPVILLEDDDGPDSGTFGHLAVRSNAVPPNLFASMPLSGQFNLLTTGSFDTPKQLFSSDNFSRSIASVSLASPVGDHADWSMRGALTQGDISSWFVAGAYATRVPARHRYVLGLSYSTQRYDGGNLAALREVTEGSRNVGAVYGFDTFTVTPGVAVTYGARFSRYDYLGDIGLLSPRVELTVSPLDHFRLNAMASSRAVAPGAAEFLPPIEIGLWLPPQRTFSSIIEGQSLQPQRTEHVAIEAERDFGASTVSFRAFRQRVNDQLVTMFGYDGPGARPGLGHYFVGNTGDLDATGWTAAFRTTLASRVHGSVEYSLTQAHWRRIDDGVLVLVMPSVTRPTVDRIHDLSTTVETSVPETSTRILVVARVSNTGLNGDRAAYDSRFDVQVNQSLPFMDFSAARWEMLVALRNTFHEGAVDASVYDELLVVRPPKRIVGGLTLRF
jgi:hypothetical protein